MNIALIGYGKMGKVIESICTSRGHKITVLVDEHNASSITPAELKKAEVAIEFSKPEAAVGNILKCFEAGIPIVVGTTGWYQELEKVKKNCEEKGKTLFYASNFSIGVNIFFKLNQELAQLMDAYPDYDISMFEAHHLQKLDAPSGTAITIAEDILKNVKRKEKWINSASKDKKELGIVSVREGEVPGTHSVTYSSEIDDITITHQAHNRKGFAMGAVLAAEWVKDKKGIFGMKDLLNY